MTSRLNLQEQLHYYTCMYVLGIYYHLHLLTIQGPLQNPHVSTRYTVSTYTDHTIKTISTCTVSEVN